jgi:hypothetical protein
MTSLRRLGAALALVLPLVLTACGGDQQVVDTGGGSAAAAVAASAHRSLAAKTQHMTMTITLDGQPMSSFDGAGTSDGSTFRGTMTMNGLAVAGTSMEYLVVDRAMYLGGFPGLPDGKRWVKMSFDDLKSSGMDMDAATQQQGNQALSMLTAAGADVTRVGSQELHGTATTHYRAVVDLRRSAKNSGVLSDEMVDQVIALLGKSTTMDVWIDADDYTRRIEYGADLSKLPAARTGLPGSGELHYVFEMSDFGEPVHVVAPPDSEVVSFSDLGGSLGSGLGSALDGFN